MKKTNDKTKRRPLLVMLTLMLCLTAGLLASCSESDDTVEEYPDWQNTNTAYWNQLYTRATDSIKAGSQNWKVIKNWSIEDTLATANTNYIIVNVKKHGTGSGCPLYTDSVRCHYVGHLLPSTSYPNGYRFNGSVQEGVAESQSIPAKFYVGDCTDGFATALQYMHIGDEWTVYVPYTLAYGEEGRGSIPGYSTLVSDITLVSYFRAGTAVPDFRAKQHSGWTTE